MGIYSDIQADFAEEMDGDLADAVATLTVTETASSTTYNPVTGAVASVPVVTNMRCLVIDADDKDEQNPDADTVTYDLEVMVLDNEKSVQLNVGLLVAVRSLNYEIESYKIDPAGATHVLGLRRR